MPRRGKRNANGHRNGGGSVHELTREEILKLIDQRARYLLGISGEEFMRKYQTGRLEHAPVEAPIRVLADLVAES